MNITSNYSLERILKNITNDIESDLIKSGVFYRIQWRCKNLHSLSKKIEEIDDEGKPKYNEIKKITDLFGIRIIFYFSDDLDVIVDHFKKKLTRNFKGEKIDPVSQTEFKPTRLNLTYKIDEKYVHEFEDIVTDIRIDHTYELQFRTIFSEGWHEVEHDFRYKCPEFWVDFPLHDRMLNGFLASLESMEWSMLQLFNNKMYDHYKRREIVPLISLKFRLRFENLFLDAKLKEILINNPILIKEILSLDRDKIILHLIKCKKFPLNMNNLIHFFNFFYLNNTDLLVFLDSSLKEIFIINE